MGKPNDVMNYWIGSTSPIYLGIAITMLMAGAVNLLEPGHRITGLLWIGTALVIIVPYLMWRRAFARQRLKALWMKKRALSK